RPLSRDAPDVAAARRAVPRVGQGPALLGAGAAASIAAQAADVSPLVLGGPTEPAIAHDHARDLGRRQARRGAVVVERARDRRRAATLAEPEHLQDPQLVAGLDRQLLAAPQHARRLGRDPADLHVARRTRLARQTPGLEAARRPQPLVE